MAKPRKPRHPRSRHWPVVRAAHLLQEPACAVCGSADRVEVHHVLPVHKFPEKELDAANLVTLCERPGHDHHYLFGHLEDWHAWNADVRADVAHWRQKIERRKAA